MNRIEIRYGETTYSVGGRTVEDLQDEIARGLGGETVWLLVNDGEGVRRDALLLITPGTPVALIPVEGDGDTLGAPRPDAAYSEDDQRR